MGWTRFFSRHRPDRERTEELAVHLEMLVDAYRATGMSEADAQRHARLALGNPRVKREELDDLNRLPVWDTLARDVRQATRVLRRSPAFTATALVTLALAIGGNTAVASLANSLLLRPLPYPQPDRLGVIVTKSRAPADATVSVNDSQDGASWEALRDRARSVDVALYAGSFGGGVNMIAGDVAAAVSQARVSAGYFRVLGVSPWLGREFTPEEDRPNGPPVVVVSYPIWQRELRGDPSVLGQTMRLRGEPFTIVGVMPATFQPPVLEMATVKGTVDVWTPARPSKTGEGTGTNYGVIARVRDGHTWSEAAGELQALGRETFHGRGMLTNGQDAWWELESVQDAVTANTREPIAMLAGAMLVVLLIACVNIAALLLARGGGRHRELATRLALGCGRRGLVRQLMVESLVLAFFGGVLGIAVGAAGLTWLKAVGGETFWTWTRATLDGRVLAGTIGLSCAASVLFGLIPALQVSRLDVTEALASGGSRSIAGGRSHWTSRAFVAVEVALGVVLLVAAGLLVRTFVNLQVYPGFDPASVTTASVSLQDARYATAERVARLFDESQAALERTPGVTNAAVSLELPYRRLLNYGFRFTGESGSKSGVANVMYVTPHFFDTLRIPLRRGRDFSATDRVDAPAVAIVNETFVRSWVGGDNPIGRRITLRDGFDREVIGVAGDVLVADQGLGAAGSQPGHLMTTPLVLIPAAQTSDGFLRMAHTWFQPTWSVRTGSGVNAARAITQAIQLADPMLPVQGVQSLSAVRASATGVQRLLLMLVGVVSIAALVLAAIGIFGLIAHGISERSREFGIRLALGDTAANTIVQLTISGLIVACVGVAVGLALAWMAVAVFDSYSVLFHVEKHDPVTFAGVGVFLLVVAAVSSFLPALRILKLDTWQILRE